MFGVATRAFALRGPVARLRSATARRLMATEPTELPGVSGATWLVGGIGIFTAVAVWVNYYDLIVWGMAPQRPKSM